MKPKFQVNQRVRMMPCKNFPKRVRYGIVRGMTDKPGMWLVNEERQSNSGEWSYIVASFRSPLAGALWWSEKDLEAMKK